MILFFCIFLGMLRCSKVDIHDTLVLRVTKVILQKKINNYTSFTIEDRMAQLHLLSLEAPSRVLIFCKGIERFI